MASHPRDGETENTVERIPLSIVAFNAMTFVPEFGMVSQVEVGATRLVGGKAVVFPQAWLYLKDRYIHVNGAEYPLDRVHYWQRAKMALSKRPKPEEINHRIGKAAK